MGRLSQRSGLRAHRQLRAPLDGRDFGSPWDSPIQRLDQLRGKTVAINDRLVFNSILTLSSWKIVGFDIIFRPQDCSRRFAKLGIAVCGRGDPAWTPQLRSTLPSGRFPRENKRNCVPCFRRRNPGYAQHADSGPSCHGGLGSGAPGGLLQRFAATDEGKRFLQASQYKNIIRVSPEFEELDVLAGTAAFVGNPTG